jgi:hypothetical protein
LSIDTLGNRRFRPIRGILIGLPKYLQELGSDEAAGT